MAASDRRFRVVRLPSTTPKVPGGGARRPESNV
jgi:hypothetical protein